MAKRWWNSERHQQKKILMQNYWLEMVLGVGEIGFRVNGWIKLIMRIKFGSNEQNAKIYYLFEGRLFSSKISSIYPIEKANPNALISYQSGGSDAAWL